MRKRIAISRGIAAVMVFLLFISVAASTLMFSFPGVINSILNINTSKIITLDEGADVNTVYYDNPYGTDYANKQATLMLELAVASENVRQAEEGMVLLKNENAALPLAEDSRITLFGNSSFHTYLSLSNSSTVEAVPTTTLSLALQKVFGEGSVNTVLGEQLYNSIGVAGPNQVVEPQVSQVIAHEETWQSDYNDVAIVTFTRIGQESHDIPMYGENGSHFLNLQAEERALMEYLKKQKEAGVFRKIVALINADNMMELGWLDEYEVDACILIGIPGVVGLEGMANILSGKVSPSGHLVDTYAYNSLSAPATTYAADNTMSWGNLDEVMAACTDTTNGGEHISNYVIYAEGIYVGYKYYETRYEDTVLRRGNAESSAGASTGQSWRYQDEVQYPFGYGLSYTSFQQSLEAVTYDPETDSYYLEVEVTNTGDLPGQSVVEVYGQTPYGAYEQEHHIEKSAVTLIGFAKTDTLQPGESTRVTVDAKRYFLASYDTEGVEGYILSAGDYYLAIGDNAHEALNNILSAKGYHVSDGMDTEGDASKVYSWKQDELDRETYRMSQVTDVEVTNQFENGDLDYYGIDFTYLSRSDWEHTFPESQVVVSATDQMMQDLNSDWYEKPEDAPEVSDFRQGQQNGLSFVDMRLVDFEDDETWEAFLDQLTVEEMLNLMPDSKLGKGIDKVGMPQQARADDSSSIDSTMTSTGDACLGWTSEVMTSRTWNKERFRSRGELMANQAAYANVTEIWYGGGNVHRTPFLGRFSQFYSEDGNFGYIIGASEADAMQGQGVNYCIKHFVLNDQENLRESLSTFATEQTIRENYLRAFEGAICEGGALSVMTGFNRIGCTYNAVNPALIQQVLYNEWGFKGHVTCDGYARSSLYKTHYLESVAAGLTFFCLDPGDTAEAVGAAIGAGDGYMLQCLRQATKRNVYAASHTVSVNGLSSNTRIVTVVPWWQITLLAINGICALGFIASLLLCIAFIGLERKSKEA